MNEHRADNRTHHDDQSQDGTDEEDNGQEGVRIAARFGGIRGIGRVVGDLDLVADIREIAGKPDIGLDGCAAVGGNSTVTEPVKTCTSVTVAVVVTP